MPMPTCTRLLSLSLLLAAAAAPHAARADNAYSHDSGYAHPNRDWMSHVPDRRLLKDLSIPGTHDTMAHSFWLSNIARTQAKTLTEQLAIGVRMLDIRCYRKNDTFQIYHGILDTGYSFPDVLGRVIAFLDDHPTETVLMRVKEEGSGDGNTKSFVEVFDSYVNDSRYKDHFYTGTSNVASIKLSDVRGKIVVMRDFTGSTFGLSYSSSDIQDAYNLDTNWDLYSKWTKVKNQLNDANGHFGTQAKFYINYLSGSGGSFPYFVASGKADNATNASRLSTGLTTPAFKDSYPDFPRVDCFLGMCTIAFNGTNYLASDYIEDHDLDFTGIVMTDFPGEDLVDKIVGLNIGATLYTDANYGGRSIPLRIGAYDLSGYNDAVSSLSVPDGLKVTLFEHTNFGGATKTITSDAASLDGGWDDKASSVMVSVDGIAVYQDSNYGGRVRIIGEGSYDADDIGIGNDAISSVLVGSGYKVVLYKDANFKGSTRTLTSDAASLGSFNDETSSLIVTKQ